MSFIQKLRIALGVAFILITAGAIIVSAQTQTAVGKYPTNTILKADSTTDPKTVEAKTQSALSTEKTAADKTAGIDSVKDSSVVRGPSVPSSKMEPETTTMARPQPVPDDKWQFQFSPYFWAAGLHGTTGTPNRSVDVNQNFSEIFDVLNFAFMSVFEARKGKFSILSDLEYVSVEDTRATPGPLFSDATANVKIFILAPQMGYRIFHNPEKGAFVDVEGGVRIWHLSSDLNFGAGILPATQVQGSRTWVDGILGLRGKTALSKKAFVTGKFNLGGGGSQFTWQLFGGLGYNINAKIALIGGYRVLDANYNKNSFIYDMNQRGPIMGLGFKF